jgi:hypothetical protein
MHFDQLHHPQGFNTLVEAFKKVETQVQQEPSEQHKNAPGKEGTRKPKIKLDKILSTDTKSRTAKKCDVGAKTPK